jgi:hypothetical protein
MRQRRFNPEEAKERRRKRTQRRKRKIGAIKKAHGLDRLRDIDAILCPPKDFLHLLITR